MLDECNDEIHIGSLTYSPSYVLEQVDPTAFRCGLLEYVDTLDVAETDEYNEKETEIDDIEERLEEIEDEINDLQE